MGEKVLHLELEIADRDIVRFLEQFDGEERRSKALEALKVGVIAIQSASPTLDTRIVEEKFREVQARISTEVEQFREDLREKLECYFRTDGGAVPALFEKNFGEEGKISRILESWFGSEGGKLASLLDGRVGPESFLGRKMDPSNRDGLSSQVEKAVEDLLKQNSAQIRSAFSLDEEGSALSLLKRSLREEIEKLQNTIANHYAQITSALASERSRIAEAEKGTGKGRDFEEALYLPLTRMATALEDDPENVSNVKGLTNNDKVGDFVVKLGPCSRAPCRTIVFEAKKQQGYNMKRTIEELERARKNRGADIGIFVFCKGYEPPEAGDFCRTGNDFIVTVDEDMMEKGQRLLFLEAAYKVARTLIAARTREEEESSIDPEFIRSEIESIQMALRNASDIRTKVGTIRNSADAIEKTMSAFEEKLETHLGNISKAIP
jgi:flagellin-like hook-associated protein FlgL